jgi:hypothetical protein
MPTSDLTATSRRGTGAELGAAARVVVVLLTVLGVVVAAAVLVYRGVGPFPDLVGCRAEADGLVVDLTTEQAENAALIAAVGVRRGLPARAVSIALATAYQESKLRNLDHGDRDSLGLFQQRPSMGWGTAREVQDPYHATNAFYDALVEVEGYRDMRITDAAQQVQRSGYPEAYQDHAADARVLASALTGYSPAGLTCVVRGDAARLASQTPGLNGRGLTTRADAVLRDVERAHGPQATGGFAPGGVTTGHSTGSAHYDGRAIDVFVRPVGEANRRKGWAIAHYLVANALRLGVDHVIFDARIWSARRSGQGWRDYEPPSTRGDRAVLEHRDHVHVDVPAGD